MGEILGVGCTHRPVMLRRNEDWTFMMQAALDDPAMPDEMKNPARWPAPLREELGNDWGAVGRGAGARGLPRHFAEARRAIDDFKPDLIVMWGDDQYENFKEDIVPPFAVLAYDDQDIQPWAHRRSPDNPWNEPADKTFRVRGHREAGKYLASRLIEAGIDVALRLQALAPPDGPCLREHAVAARRRAASGSTIRWCQFSGQLLRPAGQCGARAAPAARDEGSRPAILTRPRPTRIAAWRSAPPRRGSWPTARGGWR